jgi:hypothetical protein
MRAANPHWGSPSRPMIRPISSPSVAAIKAYLFFSVSINIVRLTLELPDSEQSLPLIQVGLRNIEVVASNPCRLDFTTHAVNGFSFSVFLVVFTCNFDLFHWGCIVRQIFIWSRTFLVTLNRKGIGTIGNYGYAKPSLTCALKG